MIDASFAVHFIAVERHVGEGLRPCMVLLFAIVVAFGLAVSAELPPSKLLPDP